MKRFLFGALGMAMVFAAPAFADGPKATAEALDAKLQAWMQSDSVSAATLAVMRHGKLIASYGHGMSPTTPYPVASLSKAITAVCLAPYIDAQRFGFDDTYSHILAPWMAKHDAPADPRFNSMTIGELLTHRAGLQRNTFGNAKNLITVVLNTMSAKLQSNPGSEYSYSNSGYALLGYLIQTLAQKRYEDACRPVLTRVGATGFIDPNMPQRAANGGWEISAVDYAKFVQVFDEHSPFLGPITQRWLLSQPGNPSYSLGVNVKNIGGRYEFFHNGKVADDEGGGSYFLKTVNDYTAVVIFAGSPAGNGYSDLFNIMKSTLMSGN